jgi:Tat protein translocase TatC
VGVVLVACLLYQDEIMWVVTRPHRIAMDRLRDRIEEQETKEDQKKPTLDDEIKEAIEKLRARDPEMAQLFELQEKKFEKARRHTDRNQGTLQALKYQEAFISYLKVSIVAALILASPWVLFQAWCFVAAGLYRREKRYVLAYLPFSFVAFGAGVLFGYYILIPEGLSYLAGYANPSVVNVNITLEFYLALFLLLTLMLGLVFQLPLLMRFLASAGIFTPRQYAKYRRYALLIAVILGAVFTPPDPVTQILLASPMFLLYELGIWLSRATVRKRKEAEA